MADVQAIKDLMFERTGSDYFPYLDEITFALQDRYPEAFAEKVLIGSIDDTRLYAYEFFANGAQMQYSIEDDKEPSNMLEQIGRLKIRTMKLMLLEPFVSIMNAALKNNKDSMSLGVFLRACFIMRGLTAAAPLDPSPTYMVKLKRALNFAGPRAHFRTQCPRSSEVKMIQKSAIIREKVVTAYMRAAKEQYQKRTELAILEQDEQDLMERLQKHDNPMQNGGMVGEFQELGGSMTDSQLEE